jgi:hypothetical protein
MRRIDLIGTDEIDDGEMQMVVVDGTDQVLVINRAGSSPRSRASARTSTSSSTRAS